jgi:hypothetical protein
MAHSNRRRPTHQIETLRSQFAQADGLPFGEEKGTRTFLLTTVALAGARRPAECAGSFAGAAKELAARQ